MPADTSTHQALIPTQTTQDVLANVYGQSAFLQQANVQPMTGPVEDVLTGEFDDTDWPAGMENVGELASKPEVGDATFSGRQMVARKMAATKVVSDELRNDSVIDIFNFYRTAIQQRFAYLIDFHALNGGGWAGSEGLLTAVTTLGGDHVVPESTDDPRGDSSAMLAAVENAGNIPSGFIFDIRKKQDFRDQLDSTGRPIFYQSTSEGAPSTLHGEQVNFLGGGIFQVAPEALRGVVGDFSNYRIGILQQIEARIFDQGTVAGVNLIEQNAQALRVEMRLGALVLSADSFAVLQQPAV